MARRYLCLFHSFCGGIAGSLEHVFPAALGGLREDRRILCHGCQKRFGDGLDKSLPADLRHFNTVLGVESRHRGRVPDAIVTDKLTGHRMWLDEHHQVRSAEPLLVSKHVDEKGVEHREYKRVGEFDRDEFLSSVKTNEGKTFEITEKTRPRPVLMARTFHGDTSFGSENTFRAVARVALNFLAAKEPNLARQAFLEPLKHWIYQPSEARSNPFVFFAEPVPGDPFVPNIFEFGHRVALGFCAKTHSIKRTSCIT